jgi:hypothetical protein
MKQSTLNAALAIIVLIGLSSLSNHALGAEADKPKENTTQSVIADKDGHPLFNYYIDANGNVTDLQPYLDGDPDAENRIQLEESQPIKPQGKDCETNQ